MITRLIARTRNPYSGTTNNQVSMFLDDGSEYRIKHIGGIGPVKATVATLDTALDAGGVFLSARDGMRNIVVTVGLYPEYGVGSTVTALRRQLAATLMPKSKVELEFWDDELGVMLISGVVETHESTPFDRDPTVQVSIICTDPYFTKQGEAQVVVPVPVLNLFTIPYEGDVPVGFVWSFDVISAFSFTLMTARSYPGRMGLTQFDMQVGDHIELSSVKGDRRVEYTRSFQTESALGYLAGSLLSMKLHDGENVFQYNDHNRVQNNVIKYTRKYGSL